MSLIITFGDKYVNSMISKAQFDYGNQTPGALNFGDNILGTRSTI